MKNIFLILFTAIIAISCGSGNSNVSAIDNGNGSNNGDSSSGGGNNSGGGGSSGSGSSGNTTGWLIPIGEVKDGGPGKDGIPSIDKPIFTNVSGVDPNILKDDDLVVGIVKNGEIRAYPYPIMNWHEIVNDNINGEPITINYCPLTGTAFAWDSKSGGVETTFGVSGLLYNNNQILYDRRTNTNWSQLRLEAVNGELIGKKPKLSNVVETDWKTWKTIYPNTKVLSTNTGFDRRYDIYPYGDYRTNQDYFLFGVNPLNNNLPHKERVYAIMTDTKAIVYRFQNFQNGKALKQSFEGKEYLVVGNENLINSFELNSSQSSLNFTFSFNNSEAFFTDNEGNIWNVFGKAISGPRTGEILISAKSVVSYWFAIAAFYPNPIISTD